MQIEEIYVRLAGGLGNQLFQLTAAQSIGLTSDIYPKTYALSGGLKSYRSPRSCQVDVIQLCFPEINLATNAGTLMRGISHLRIPRFVELDALGVCTISSSQKVLSVLDSRRKIKTILLDGYFQDVEILKRCAHLRSGMHESLASRYTDLVIGPSTRPNVGIHTRKGDYLGSEFVVLPLEYYQRAAGLFSSCDFYVFGDDPSFVKEVATLVSGRAIIGDEQTPLNDFVRFMSCDHHIIANSTFSLYASYIASFKGGRVILPKSWYKNGVNKFLSLVDCLESRS